MTLDLIHRCIHRTKFNHHSHVENQGPWIREVAQWLRACTILMEDPCLVSSTQGFMNARPTVPPSYQMSSLVGIWIFYFRSTILFTAQGVPASCFIEESCLSQSRVPNSFQFLLKTSALVSLAPTHLSLSIKCPL